MAVKTYSYAKQGNTKCSTHTKVREMASKSGNKLYSDKVLIDDTLMTMIEKLFAKLQCSKYLISSGYRTPEHDNGAGQHTTGKAVDACFYGKDGNIIPAQIVCCVAQDLGFKGIANISRNYKYVHLDMRSAGTYKGDEIKSYNTVTKNFYDYFNISKAEVEKYTGREKVEYFKKYIGSTTSIVSALNSIGAVSTYAERKKIATANGIKLYCGTAKQNTTLLNLLKQGKLIKP